MKTPRVALLVLLLAAVFSSAAAVTTRHLPPCFRSSPPPAPPLAFDPGLMSQVARAQAAVELARHPGAAAFLAGY
ncbi:MAG TPA: hypothetical protein VMD31_09420 [Opitutaceae bacterium]|nr:hypothetical protein [Opitutaceae bacterium]